MTTTVNLRKLLHRKAWEMCTPAIASPIAGAFLTGDSGGAMPANDCVYFVNSGSAIYNYNADQDAWLQLPASGITGTFGAGACGEFTPLGAPGGSTQNTATAGSTTTLTTNRTLVRDIRGSKLRVVAGTGVGYDGAVASNTVGANSIITVTPASGVAFDATSVFQVWSGSLWFFNAGAGMVGLGVYDRATNAWTAKSVAGLPTTWATCGQLVSTGSIEGAFETGISSGSNTSTTLNKASAAWAVNAYTNAQLRITGGTGAGQVRTVASNTATALTVSAVWTVTPDATSTFAIEGNDDNLYLLGNNAITAYKYSISGNSWATLAPGAARGTTMGAGGTADWINGVTDADWSGAQGKVLTGTHVKQNGRFIYSFAGASNSSFHVYDIAANTWYGYAGAAYGNGYETFTTGSCSVDLKDHIYHQKEATGRLYRFDVNKHALEPWNANPYPQSTTVEGDKMLVIPYKDGATVIPYLYTQQHSRAELLRMMAIG